MNSSTTWLNALPMAEEDLALRLLAGALPQLQASFQDLPVRAQPAPAFEAMASVMSQVAERMADNYPYFHPLYAGQMLKPPHPLASAAYALAMHINPNNHALDGGRASSRMEVEAVRAIAAMFGWTNFLGHSPAAEPLPTWRRSGSQANWLPASASSPLSRRTTLTAESALSWACPSLTWRPITGAGWTWRRSSPLFKEETLAPLW